LIRDEGKRRVEHIERIQQVVADIAAGKLTDAAAIGQLLASAISED
jgi:hypothetical protein